MKIAKRTRAELDRSPRVRSEVRDGIAYVRLARPAKLNGLDVPMLHALAETPRRLRRDPAVRAVILAGDGDAFCAGLDFASVGRDPQGFARVVAKLPGGLNVVQRACWAWRELPVPVIAVLHGHCYGGGLQLALAAYFRIAATFETAAPHCDWLNHVVAVGIGNGAAQQLLDRMRHLVLPVVTLAYAQLAIFARFSKSALTEVIQQDYITTARAKGVAPQAVLWRHAFRNALIPLITLLGLTIPFLISGSVIVEQIFQWDGIGRLYFDSILSRDYPTVLGLTVATAVVTLLAGLLADLLYAVADPRIRLEELNR